MTDRPAPRPGGIPAMRRDPSRPQADAHPRRVPPLLLELDQVLDPFTRRTTHAEFTFDPAAPAVITVEFLTGRGPRAVRHIGRELLQRGLIAMSGCGDVQMWPTLTGERPTSWLLLDSDGMDALFEVPAEPLSAWLGATYRVTSAAAELDGLDWDGFLDELFDGGE